MERLDSDKLQLTDPFAVINGVLPAFFRIALLQIEEPQHARQGSLEVAAVCRQIAPSSHNPSVWTQAAKLMEAFGTCNDDGERDVVCLADHANDCREIQILSYLVGSFDRDLQSAFTTHVIGLANADEWYRRGTSVYTELFSPFIETYWRNAFANRRFEFSVPSIVEAELALVSTHPIEQKARATLKAVSSSFSTRDAGECAQWLRR
ncbi:MAG: hypothetical protein WD049_09765 [Candidatus Paceibacterota bacterium]